MYFKYYKLVIAEILLFLKITNVHNFQDSIYLNDSYELSSARRYERQVSSNDCLMPPHRLDTKYKILDKLGFEYNNTEYAKNFEKLEIICVKGYKLKPFAPSHSVCVGGMWIPRLSTCFRACSSLKSISSTNVSCADGSTPLENCYNPVEGTTAVVTCNALHEDPRIDQYPSSICTDGKWQPSIPQCHPICGQRRPLGTENVINGIDALLGDYPWHVGIYDAASGNYTCGGSIIVDRNIILSAAHCFTDYDGKAYPEENYIVAAGKYHRLLNHTNEDYVQLSTIQKIHIPKRYKGSITLQAHDIAILILENPFSISYAVQPICIELTKKWQNLHLTSDSIGKITGWGYTKPGENLADILQEVDIPYIPFEDCFEELPMTFKQYLNQDKICGGYKNSGTSACIGDSGGGFFFLNEILDRFYIKGVVSTIPATRSQTCDSDQYTLFTATSSHLSFIRRTILNNRLLESVICKYDKCSSTEEEEEEDIVLTNNTDEDYEKCCELGATCNYIYFSCKDHKSLFKRMVNMVF